MFKITVIFLLTILCLAFLSSTNGDDPWKEQLRKRLARASSPTDFDWWWWQIFWRQTTTRRTRSTTTVSRTTRTTTAVPRTTTTTPSRVTTRSTTRRTTSPSTTRITTPSTTTSGSSSSFTNFQLEALAQTNKYRADHCAPNLVLDANLNSIAQAYAVKLVELGYLEHSDNGYGENLYYAGFGQATNVNSIKGSVPIDSWYSEVDDYNWSSPGFASSTGHFTQLVWINTKKMGIGIACTNDRRRCYMVANYSPPGNYGNEYRANVKAKGSC